ncbi:PepSY domain-containing protein [Ancylobacter sp.]|uniref:PepSY domain-containing protein n=1 Tax=Ancylobacter sp. TaxID=1872567 RepID=UPI003D1478C8
MKSLGYAVAALAFAALPALAQTPTISAEDALRIARDGGLTTITSIELDDGEWEAEGRDSAGKEMEIDINAATGAVVRREID